MVLNFLRRHQKDQIKMHVRSAYWIFCPPIVEIEGVKIAVSRQLSVGMQNFLVYGEYEKSELMIVKEQLTVDDRVMELGTGVGLLSTYCAKIVGSDQVFTYEANPMLEDIIRNTYRLNHVSPTLSICLLGDTDAERTFYVDKDFWASSTVRRSTAAKSIQVKTKSFAEEVRRINPSFLLLDIEGGEYDLLINADFHNIKKIMIEFHGDLIGEEKIQAVRERFIQNGFRPHPSLCTVHHGFYER